MRATILPKAHRAVVSIMAKECIVTRVLPLMCFLFLTLSTYMITLVHNQ